MSNITWRGCENIKLHSNGSQGDSDLIYKEYIFNYWDIEDALWESFLEENPEFKDSDAYSEPAESRFNEYVQENAENYLEDCIAGDYFAPGGTSWHDTNWG